MAQTLGPDVPFTVIAANASDVFSLSMSKTEAWYTQQIRDRTRRRRSHRDTN